MFEFWQKKKKNCTNRSKWNNKTNAILTKSDIVESIGGESRMAFIKVDMSKGGVLINNRQNFQLDPKEFAFSNTV